MSLDKNGLIRLPGQSYFHTPAEWQELLKDIYVLHERLHDKLLHDLGVWQQFAFGIAWKSLYDDERLRAGALADELRSLKERFLSLEGGTQP
jgi:hypothetical protein